MKSQIYKLVSSKFNWVKDIIQGAIWLWEFHWNAIGLTQLLLQLVKSLWYDNRNANQSAYRINNWQS
jgi:hypothetical protein